MEVFKVFNSGFRISDSKQLISFSSEIINFTEEYVKFLIQRGKIYLRDNSSASVTAVNITHDLFILENGYLVNFKRLFEGASDSINTEDEFMKEMRSLLFPFIMDKLCSEYKNGNPIKREFDECLMQMEAEGRILVTNIFTGKYIHRKPVDFSSAKCMKKGTLLYLLRTKNGTKHLTIESFLYFVFDLLESQTIYLHTLPYFQAMQIYKLLISEINKSITPVSNEILNSRNYPNPFNSSTVIRFQVSAVSDVLLKVFDAMGREVQTLVNERLQQGTYSVDWNASSLSSGVYFYRLTTEKFSAVKKMMLVK